MDFEPNADQVAILDGLEQLIASIDVEAPKEGVFAAFSPALDRSLEAAGSCDISQEEGCSLLDAALVVERVARLPVSVEAAASALVAPLLQEAGVRTACARRHRPLRPRGSCPGPRSAGRRGRGRSAHRGQSR